MVDVSGPEADQGGQLCRWSKLSDFLSLEHGTTFETGVFPGSKLRWKTAPQAGTDPTAGRLESAVGERKIEPICFQRNKFTSKPSKLLKLLVYWG